MKPEPIELDRPALFDTGVWTWVRDRRFPHFAEWFNRSAAEGLILISDLVAMELLRLAPNYERADLTSDFLFGFERIPTPPIALSEARDIQMELAKNKLHRSIPPTDILQAVTAVDAAVPLIHYDKDFEAIAKVSGLDARWFVEPGSLAP